MTKSQQTDQSKSITKDRFQFSRRTQNYSAYSFRSNAFLSISYQYQNAFSNNQFFYQFNFRQHDSFEYQSRDARSIYSQVNRYFFFNERYFKKKSTSFDSVLSSSKQSLQIISENNANASNSAFREVKSKNQRDYKRKERAYVIEKHEKKMKKSYNENDEYYHEQNQDLDYYDSSAYVQNQFEVEINFFISSRSFKCKRCKTTFSSNNQLHKHLRQDNCTKKSLISQRDLEKLTAHLIMNISIVEFTIDFFKDIDTSFEFRD
jgi:hypothetical protein